MAGEELIAERVALVKRLRIAFREDDKRWLSGQYCSEIDEALRPHPLWAIRDVVDSLIEQNKYPTSPTQLGQIVARVAAHEEPIDDDERRAIARMIWQAYPWLRSPALEARRRAEAREAAGPGAPTCWSCHGLSEPPLCDDCAADPSRWPPIFRDLAHLAPGRRNK